MSYDPMEAFVDAVIGRIKSKYETYSANIYNYDYTTAMLAENQRYWADYKKNTGISPRYPYRSGAVYNDAQRLYAKSARSRGTYDFGQQFKW